MDEGWKWSFGLIEESLDENGQEVNIFIRRTNFNKGNFYDKENFSQEENFKGETFLKS